MLPNFGKQQHYNLPDATTKEKTAAKTRLVFLHGKGKPHKPVTATWTSHHNCHFDQSLSKSRNCTPFTEPEGKFNLHFYIHKNSPLDVILSRLNAVHWIVLTAAKDEIT